MNKALLRSEVQEFIEVNLRTDLHQLILKKPVFEGVTNKELAQQILGKLKSKDKLPTWFQLKNALFPPKISIEQTSSELTAQYKAGLISGKKIIDVTGGFGVDVYYFSQVFDSVVHCEMNRNLSEITASNFEKLGVTNCHFVQGDGVAYVEENEVRYDWIYLDPSRRNEVKGKVFLLKDCLPNVPDNLELLFSKSNKVMMKTSPLVDISQGISELSFVKEIHIVAVKNEVKELIWVLEEGYEGYSWVLAVNLAKKGNQIFEFQLNEESESTCRLSQPLSFLYEPNSAILKSGSFNQVGIQNKLGKLHKHSHLYTHSELIDFPGRRFRIMEVIPFQGKEIKKRLGGKKANITTRNFPKKVEELRKTLKIKEGGEVYLFFTTNLEEEKICVVCTKVT